MHVNERLRQGEPGNLVLGIRPRHEMHLALVECRINADAAQRIEVHLHLVAIAHPRVEMREALAPPAAAVEHDRRHAIARTEQA